jgi:Zn-dependent peptidase ImmA (M78 family)/DNA-binding XRE family transcriptional regulator
MVTLAREAAGLTQSSLATGAGVSQALVSKIEAGLESPSEELLQSFATQCMVPSDFFRQEDHVLGEGLVDFFHKRRLTLPAKPLKRANALMNIVRLEVVRLLSAVELTDVAPFPVVSPDEYSVDEIARIVRATWRIPPGPLPNLIALMEAAAVPVFLLDLGHEKLSAISMPGFAGRHVVAINRNLPPSAQRFALAHELGHLVMHNGAATDDMERDAETFAAALLMPADDIRRHLRAVRFHQLGPLKPVWRVSLAALIRRAHDLGGISDRHYRTLNIQLNRLPGGRKREPGEFAPEEPRLMRQIISHYRNNLSYSTRDVAQLMVANEEALQERYFGEVPRTLRVVGRPSESNLHRVPVTGH